MQCTPQCTPKRPSSEPHGATRQQAIAKKPVKEFAYEFFSVTVLFVRYGIHGGDYEECLLGCYAVWLL
jgi:hypothetical protein